MSTSPVHPSDAEWSAWATLANDVSDALRELPERVLFSRRNAVARAMWDAGYRPTDGQITAVRERQARALG